MMTMYTEVDSISEYINVLEDAWKRSARAAMPITDEQVMAIASRVGLGSGYYDTECQQWTKLPKDQFSWVARKATFRDANTAHI